MRISDWSSDVCSSDLNRPILIALDPGHGGEDPGAIGRSGTREKDIVLSIARRLKKLIDSQPNMRAYLTRDNDYFVPLHVRRSEEHTSELQSLMRTSYAVFCLQKKKQNTSKANKYIYTKQ